MKKLLFFIMILSLGSVTGPALSEAGTQRLPTTSLQINFEESLDIVSRKKGNTLDDLQYFLNFKVPLFVQTTKKPIFLAEAKGDSKKGLKVEPPRVVVDICEIAPDLAVCKRKNKRKKGN